MTKIYLVEFRAWDKVNENHVHIVYDVFTNKKKAEIYAEYKQLSIETKKPDYLSTYEGITFKVEEFTINTLDWTNELIKLQEKNLPY